MHDVPALVWSNAMYDNVKKTFPNDRTLKHSKSYDVPPPAGPAGENLAGGSSWADNSPWGSDRGKPEEATGMWYDEIKDCGPFPGCERGKRGVTGHFTAMIWDGVKELGCYSNPHGIRACQYRSGDRKGCETCNMMGNYEKNVFRAVHSMDYCKKILQECKSGGGGGGGGGGNPRRRAPAPRRRAPDPPRRRSNSNKKKKKKGGGRDKGSKKKKKGGRRLLLSALLGSKTSQSSGFGKSEGLDRCYAEWLSSAVAARLKEFVEREL